jgi:hypothetical protein
MDVNEVQTLERLRNVVAPLLLRQQSGADPGKSGQVMDHTG